MIINKDKEKIPVIYSKTPVSEGSLGIFTNMKEIKEKGLQAENVKLLD